MLALLVANLKIMLRDRQALLWAVLFPLILVVAFGVFDFSTLGSVDLGVVDLADTASSRLFRRELVGIDYLDVRSGYASQADAEADLEDRDLNFVLVIPESFASLEGPSDSRDRVVALPLLYGRSEGPGNQLVIDAIRHVVDRENIRLSGFPQTLEVAAQETETNRADYFDVLLIGLIGMGMMTNSIIFIAVKISMYRNQSILKRMLVTPLPVRKYFASEVVAHLLLALVQAGVVIGMGVLVFGANIQGNLLWLFVIVAFANTIFLNIGFIISGWANSPRAASGLGNVVAIPMMFFSGTFFPTSSLPSFLPELVQVLPLTPMLDAMRGVAIDDLQLWDVRRELAMLAGWLAFSSVAAVKLFKFG